MLRYFNISRSKCFFNIRPCLLGACHLYTWNGHKGFFALDWYIKQLNEMFGEEYDKIKRYVAVLCTHQRFRANSWQQNKVMGHAISLWRSYIKTHNRHKHSNHHCKLYAKLETAEVESVDMPLASVADPIDHDAFAISATSAAPNDDGVVNIFKNYRVTGVMFDSLKIPCCHTLLNKLHENKMKCYHYYLLRIRCKEVDNKRNKSFEWKPWPRNNEESFIMRFF